MVFSFADAALMRAHRNVLIVGPIGVGKTFVAWALAQPAVRHGHTSGHLRMPRTLSDLARARRAPPSSTANSL